MAAIAIGAWGLVLVGAYGLVRGVELAVAWWRFERRVTDARRRNRRHVYR